jgi:LmbE family N-acetylglucosaminyl deacetylase
MYSCKSVVSTECEYNILVVLAHPDDETLISGTLAKLSAQGSHITVVYTTSGDDGPDMTRQGLYGDALAEVREREARKSLLCIGDIKPPLFLKFPDSHVSEHREELMDTLSAIFQQIDPDVVITFGPDGVTDDLDHITTGYATDRIVDGSNNVKLLVHLAISQKASSIYPIPSPVADHLIDLHVDVSAYKRTRFKSNNAHRTQFGIGGRLFWKIFVRRYPYEEFVIVSIQDGEQILQNCF